MTSSARIRRRDKQFESLVKENVKLHDDVKELEKAYQLHRHTVEQDRNSVHGLIRSEIGGSRWQHGGTGKLTTHISSKDLMDDAGTSTSKKHKVAGSTMVNSDSSKTSRVKQQSTIEIEGNRRVKLVDELIDTGKAVGSMENEKTENKIPDLKAKVLKKASTKIIRRDTWAGHSDVKYKACDKNVGESDYDRTFDNMKNVLKAKVIDERAIPNSRKVFSKQKGKDNLRYDDQRSGERNSRRSRLDIHEITKKAVDVGLEKQKIDCSNGQRNTKEMPIKYIDQYSDRSNADRQNTENSIQNRTEVNSLVTENGLVNGASITLNPTKAKAELISENNIDLVYLNNSKPLNESTLNSHSINCIKNTDRNVSDVKKADTGLKTFQTEAPECTEIYIDTESGQIRIKSGDENMLSSQSNLDGTKVLIQHGTVNKSVDGQKLPCTIVEESHSLSAQQEVRDIFGLSELDRDLKSVSNNELNGHGSSVSPFVLVKECNSEVEFWLHGLGLQDVDKYVKIFADHEIDLLDLEFMTAAQLHDMGVTALGALDKILKGVKDLRGASKLSLSGSGNDHSGGKHLQMSSIAWEEDKDRTKRSVRKSFDTSLNTHKDKNKCDESMVSKSSDTLTNRQTSVRESRPSSVLSVHSDYGESILSSRSKVTGAHPSFTASTKASSAKCVEKRPPSSKSATQTKSKSQQKSYGKVKRSESNVTEKSAFKLSHLEGKPAKGVLIRPRSSSLSREVMPKKPITQERDDKEVKGRNLRYRSRSADAVKRKAMEGVQTAAKKFEEKLQRDKDSKQTLYHRDERMKARRDEMAARHIQREKHRELINEHSSDTEEEVSGLSSNRDSERKEGLDSLVQVNILSQSGPVKCPAKGKTLNDSANAEEESDVRRSLRRVEPARRPRLKSLAKPVELQLNTSKIPPTKLTAKMNLKDQEKSPRSQSEPESGYKTDGSTSYSHIEDRVSEIQKKIKRLKARASTGDDLTGTLVQDLQIQLQQFEQILGTKHGDLSWEPIGTPGTSNEGRNNENSPCLSNMELNKESGLRRSASMEARKSSPIEELLAEDQKIKMNPEFRVRDEEVVRMSKRELLDEMRKEKKHHHLQIRQLQKELERIRHADPVTSMEIHMSDIVYREEDMVGEGAFSKVYKGLYQGSEVAIKKLKVPLRSQDRNYFTAELSLLKELRHPRVVLLIGVCTTDKLPLMVLEYMSRGSLYNYLHDPENEPFDHALYFQVARDITAGMKYLHSHRPEVIHLDLKSMNVLLCQSYRAKIADFGFSKLRHDAGVKSKSSVKQTNVSTPAWMSPELLNKGEVTTKSDVYSFAVILWEMLTRKEPYSNLSVFQILERVRKNKRPEIPVSAPEGLQLLISQCWDPNPAKRPHFKDILQVLENLEFPPAWRELFKKAGVPDEALSNVYSTRNIIKLVTDTLELPGYPNFMLNPMSKVNERSRYSISDNAMKVSSISSRSKSSQKEITGSPHNTTSNSARKLDSQRDIISERDKWEADTVTTLSGGELSDESEVTLKDMKDSSSDESALSSESDHERPDSVSDVASTVPVTLQRLQRRPVNVFIPNLELSIESARKEFSLERDRISRSSWLSISLDDRTDRSEENQTRNKEEKYVNKSKVSETSLNLLSNRSGENSSPSAVLLTEDNSFNESAGNRRTDRHVQSPSSQSSSEYIMRESFSNRRPPSPKKKSSFTKKLLDKSLNSAISVDSTRSDTVGLDSVPVNTVGSFSDRSIKSLGNKHVDCSYDSFFGIPIQNNQSDEKHVSSVQTSDINSELDTQGTIHDSHVLFDKQDKSFELDRKKSTVTRSDVYLVDSESETVPKEKRQNREEVVDEVKRYIDQKVRTSLSISRDKIDSEFSLITHADSHLPHISSKSESHTSAEATTSSQDNLMTSSVSNNICQIDSIMNESTKTAENVGMDNDTHGERSINFEAHREPVETLLRTSNESVTVELDHMNTEPRQSHLERRAGSKSARIEKQHDKLDISKSDTRHSIDVNFRTRSSKVPKIDDKPIKEKRKNVLRELELPKRKDSNNATSLSKSTEIKHDGGGQIRVVLNPKDVTDKKKPAITPRKSKMKIQNVNNQQVEQTGKDMKIPDRVLDEPIENRSEAKKSCTEKPREYLKSQISDPNTKTENLASASITRESNSLMLQGDEVVENEVPKSNKIRVKLRKNPLAPKLVAQCPASPVPPAPPPPPVGNLSGSLSVMSKSMQIEAPRLSMADELKNKINQRQSISEGMKIVRKNTGNSLKPVKPENIIGPKEESEPGQYSKPVNPAKGGEPVIVPTNTENDLLAPQPSDGLPSFVLQSLELRDQKDHLRSISKPHPNQLDDLSGASQEQLSSIADILRKAVMGRRFAMGEDADSVSQSFDSVATGWSVDLN